MTEKIREMAGGSLKGVTVAMLGLSFKPNTDDARESPAVRIAAALMKEGARVRAYDPAAMKEAGQLLPDLELATNEYEAIEGSDLLVLATEWNQFRSLDLSRVRELLKKPVVVDLRNIYEPKEMRELGFEYSGVGR